MKFSPILPARRGFTLIELLVVMAIMGLLLAMTVTYLRGANEKANLDQTLQNLKAVQDALAGYKNDNAELPEPVSEKEPVDVRGESWPGGSAQCLYQALTGDGDDAIVGGKEKSTGNGETSTGENYLKPATPGNKKWVLTSNGNYYLVDAFSHPWQYRKPTDKNKDELNNPGTYDLWSYGKLKKPAEGKDAEKEYIKNW